MPTRSRTDFADLGRAIGTADTHSNRVQAHLTRTVTISPAIARTLDAVTIDIVTERMDGQPFDLAIATNILPYFDDVELMLAVSNVAAMLAPGGMFLHNEMRPAMQEVAQAAGLTFTQARQAIIATVRGSPAPLADSIWIHRKAAH